MKISELIKKLDLDIFIYGDIDVKIESKTIRIINCVQDAGVTQSDVDTRKVGECLILCKKIDLYAMIEEMNELEAKINKADQERGFAI